MRKHRPRLLALSAGLIAAALALSGCGTKGTGSPEQGAPGVTADSITLGVITDLTGPFAAGARQQLAGAQIYWDSVNADGGVCGRQVQLLVRDHQYDPQLAVSAYSEISSQVLGLQISLGSPTTAAIRPQVEQDGMPTIPISFSPSLLDSEALIVPGTTYDVEMVNAVDYLIEQGELASGDTIGYVYLQGEFGEPGFAGASYAAQRNGIEVLGRQIDPTVPDLATQIGEFRRAGVSAIFLSATPPQVASAASVATTEGFEVPIVASIPGWAPELMDTAAAQALVDRVRIVSPVAPFNSDAPGPTQLRELFGQQPREVPASWGVSLGYALGAIMDQTLARTCEDGELTRESVLTALRAQQTIDSRGTIVDLSYTQPGVTPSTVTHVTVPQQGAPGGLVAEQLGYTGPDVAPYLDEQQ